LLGDGRDVNNSGRGALPKEREKLSGEEEAGEVVDLEVKLMTVVTESPGPFQPYAGIVEEYVEPRVVTPNRSCECPDFVEGTEVC